MNARKTTKHEVTMTDRPGELARLTRALTEAGIEVSELRIANLGGTALVQYTTPRGFIWTGGTSAARRAALV